MKQQFVTAFLIILTIPVFSQFLRNDTASDADQQFLQPKKFNYNLTLGSQFTTASGFGSALNTFVTPRVSYNLNKRLTIGGGISIIQTNYFDAKSYFQNEQGTVISSNGNFTSGLIFIDGQYMVNKRLTISGSAYKQFPISKDPLPYNPFNPVSSKGAQGINFNVGYKIGEHMYIQAGFRYNEGVNPWYNDPFNQNPFMNDSFGSYGRCGVPRW